MTANRTLHILIHGRVQGVGFRAWIHHQAELHGLKGWVRNRRDGAVEALFYGRNNLIEVMLKTCGQGPRGSVVERVEVVESGAEDAHSMDGFEVRETN